MTGGLQDVLHSVKEEVEELLRVTLDAHVGWLSRQILVRETEVEGVSCASLTQFQEAKQALELAKYVIIHFSLLVSFNVFWCGVDRAEKLIAEGRDHVELLEHGYHVADVAEVVDTRVLVTSLPG